MLPQSLLRSVAWPIFAHISPPPPRQCFPARRRIGPEQVGGALPRIALPAVWISRAERVGEMRELCRVWLEWVFDHKELHTAFSDCDFPPKAPAGSTRV